MTHYSDARTLHGWYYHGEDWLAKAHGTLLFGVSHDGFAGQSYLYQRELTLS